VLDIQDHILPSSGCGSSRTRPLPGVYLWFSSGSSFFCCVVPAGPADCRGPGGRGLEGPCHRLWGGATEPRISVGVSSSCIRLVRAHTWRGVMVCVS
jgi:hypothetical protein